MGGSLAFLVLLQGTGDPFISIPSRPEQEPVADSFQVECAVSSRAE